MNRTHGRFALGAAALVFGGIFTACLGQSRGGSDSETHFACSTDGYCRTLGSELRCVEGYCRSSVPRAHSTMAASPVTDGGLAGANATAPSVDAGKRMPSPEAALVDGAVPGPWDQPLASPITLSGNIMFAPGTAAQREPNVWVALVWDLITDSDADPECGGGAAREHMAVEQPVDIEIRSNGEFSIHISKTPPYAAFPHPATSGEANQTRGALVAYEDSDRNGRLDFSTPSAPSADTVIGTSSPLDVDPLIGYPRTRDTYRLQYSDAGGGEFIPRRVLGYGIMHWADYETTPPENLPIETSIPILLDAGLAAQELVCNKVCLSTATEVCPAHVSELPTQGEGRCTPPGAIPGPAYRWIGTACNGCRCTPLECDFPEDVNGLDPDWPCRAAAP